MQTLIQVVCTKGLSLREAIANDPKLEDHALQISLQQKSGRSRGWTKVRSTDPLRHGAINMEWHAPTCMLLCRVVNRGKARPNLIIGDFIDYLIERHGSRI